MDKSIKTCHLYRLNSEDRETYTLIFTGPTICENFKNEESFRIDCNTMFVDGDCERDSTFSNLVSSRKLWMFGENEYHDICARCAKIL